MIHRHQPAPFAATCPDCDVERNSESATELVEFYRRHYRHTGHDIVVTRADLDRDLASESGAAVADELDAAATGDVAGVVDSLEAEYGIDENDDPDSGTDGVPIGLVAAAMSKQGFTVGETLEAIYEDRMTGALYEPRDDHLAVF